MKRTLDVATSYLASTFGLAAGMYTGAIGPRPARRLELFEFEACPYCRRVRAALSILDLEATIYPCPKGGRRYRSEAVRRGGKAQFPYLVDSGAGVEMYESSQIVAYLFEQYGNGRPPPTLGAAGLFPFQLASAMRAMRGLRARPARKPEKPLELWSFESSPYCRIARERLCELELPYVLHNVAKRSPSRPGFVARSGRMQVPWLLDPNTGETLFESADICSYLEATYGL